MTANNPPPFFETIRQKSSQRWDQLERDPELAGPWKQLFNQVQSPKHVVSELLQNADDAGATSVVIELNSNRLEFTHNGEDFQEEHFASLCRFAYSNKRSLHTIGFRGIGFKSTFSLGAQVFLTTPTLSVFFDRNRFTEPVWVCNAESRSNTRVSVKIEDENREEEIRGNLSQWLSSPISLLFFKNIRELQILGRKVALCHVSPGPTCNSDYMRLSADENANAMSGEVLLIRSDAETMPIDCIHEIRQERGDPTLELPPVEVSLVLGSLFKNRIYVVLPTGVELDFPFSINAPFLQDPARFAIKEPSISPTNRWLLKKAGQLAAQTMVDWLNRTDLTISERCDAYRLFPTRQPSPLDSVKDVAHTVLTSMKDVFLSNAILISSAGHLCSKDKCIGVPRELHTVWNDEQIKQFFGCPNKSLFAQSVDKVARDSLARNGYLVSETLDDVAYRLQHTRPPRPDQMEKIALLWRIINPKFPHDYRGAKRRQINIVPVRDDDRLGKAEAVVKPSAARLDDTNLSFLSGHLCMVDPEWDNFLSANTQQFQVSNVDDIRKIAVEIGLFATSLPERVVEQAMEAIQKEVEPEAYKEKLVRLTHISAAISAELPKNFLFLTRANELQTTSFGLVCLKDGARELPAPAEWQRRHLLSQKYTEVNTSCTTSEWNSWLDKPESRLWTIVPLMPFDSAISKLDFEKLVKSRGGRQPKTYPYKVDQVAVTDYDLPTEVVQYLDSQVGNTQGIWSHFLEPILRSSHHKWSSALFISAKQDGLTMSKSVTLDDSVPSKWVIRLRSRACIPDTHGKISEPSKLYMRTPETEPFMGVETFVRADLDKEQNKQLLRLLGVRDQANSIHQVIDRVRSVSKMTNPESNLAELARWYDVLDRLMGTAKPEDVNLLKQVFESEALILSNNYTWHKSSEIYLTSDDASHSFVSSLHAAVRGKLLWGLVGVQNRPTVSSSLNWLNDLEVGEKLDSKKAMIARGILKSFPGTVWNTNRRWLSLAGTWVKVETLRFRMTMQELGRYSNLYLSIRESTADLRMLDSDTINAAPFSSLLDLKAVATMRPIELSRKTSRLVNNVPWLVSMASTLQRVKFQDDKQFEVRKSAARLENSKWHEVPALKVQPWIEGKVAGEPITAFAVWEDLSIFVSGDRSKWFESLAEELSTSFPETQGLRDVIRDCLERSPEWIEEYLIGLFDLDPACSVKSSNILTATASPAHGVSDQTNAALKIVAVESGSMKGKELRNPSFSNHATRATSGETNAINVRATIPGEPYESNKVADVDNGGQSKTKAALSEPLVDNVKSQNRSESPVSSALNPATKTQTSDPVANRGKLIEARSRESLRRRNKLLERIAAAPVRESVQKVRSVSNLNRSDVDKEGLWKYYRDDDGKLFCQMCCESMPFLKRNGIEFSEFVSVFRMDWAQKHGVVLRELTALNLVLCPTCSRIYEEYVHRSDRIQTQVCHQFLESEKSREVIVRCSEENSVESDRILTFDPTHISDIRVFLEQTSLD